MITPLTPLPILPANLLRRHHCDQPFDTRFRAVARLRQSLWRQAHGFPCGYIADAHGKLRRLGSRLTPRLAQRGANIIDPTLVPLVRREVAYREIGALIDVERLWGNLLASQPLAFSLFAPLKADLSLATAVFTRLLPDFVGTVTDLLFEHSPGRGDPAFTGDHTAFDALVRCTTPAGHSACLAIELKYSEAPASVVAPPRPRWATLSSATGIFRDPDSPELRSSTIEQFWREQLLLTAMLQHGLYERGRLLVIAPVLNRECQQALARYTQHLVSADPVETSFQTATLEQMVATLGDAGAEELARRLTDRYLDFDSVDAALLRTFQGQL
jgi:hypothetical protein